MQNTQSIGISASDCKGRKARSFQVACTKARVIEQDNECLSICMADVQPEPVDWMWFPYVAFGKCTVVDGDPGKGKSFFTTKVAACMSQGEKLPGMEQQPKPVSTLMLAREDGAGDTIRPRLDGCGANVKRVFLLNSRLELNDAGLKRLKAEIERLQAQLVTIDPLNSYLPKGVKITDNAAMRQFIDKLVDLAAETGAAIVIVRHLNKGQGSAIQRGAGVMDTIGGCRAGLTVASDPQDEDRAIVALSKHNLTGKAPSIAFRITKAGKFAWDGTSYLQADDLLAEPESAEDRSALAGAMDFLRQELGDGPLPSTLLFERGKKEGHAERTLRRASDDLKLVKRKAKKDEEHPGRWIWSLAPLAPEQVGHAETVGQVGQVGQLPHLIH